MNTLQEIIDAVSDILLVFQEAQADPFNELVIKRDNMGIMVTEVTKMMEDRARDSANIEDSTLRERLLEANHEIGKSLQELQNLVTSSGSDSIPRKMYEPLHAQLKKILQGMVLQLQIADQINCNIVFRGCKKFLDTLFRFKNVQVAGGVALITPYLHKYFEELDKDVRVRVAEITNPDLRTRMHTAVEIIHSSYQSLPEKTSHALTSKNHSEKDALLEKLGKAVEDIIIVTEESGRFVKEYLLQFGLPPEQAKKVNNVSRLDMEDELDKLEEAVRNRDVQSATQAARAFASASAEQIELARALAARSQDPYWKNALLSDASRLGGLTPQIVEATKYALQHSEDRQAPQKLNALIAEAKAIGRRIDNANKSEQEALQKRKALKGSLETLEKAAKSGNVAATEKALQDALQKLRDEIAFGKAAALEAKNPVYKAKIESAVAQLEKLEPLLAQAARDLAANPNDKEAQKRFDALSAEAKRLADEIARAVIEDKLYENKQALKATAQHLLEAAQRGDKAEVEKQLSDLKDFIKRRIELGRELAELTDDPILKKQILDACNELERLLPLIEEAARYAAAHPDDPEAQKRLADLLDQMKNASARITAEKLYPTAIDQKNVTKGAVFDSTVEMNSDLEKLKDLIKDGNYNEAEKLAKDLGAKAKRQIQLAKMLASKTDDPKLKQALLDAAKDLEAIFSKLTDLAEKGFSDPKNRQEALKLIDQAQEANKKMAEVTLSKDTKEKEAEKKAPPSEVVQSEYSEIRPDGSKDRVMVAAHDVTRAVNEAKRKGRETPASVVQQQNTLLDLAAQIGKEMEQLSLAAQRGSKQDMIAAARRIAEMINQVQKLSDEIASKCKDPRLKEALLNSARVPKNFAIQLKIISGVKSNTADDPTAEAQLVNCAQQLAQSVINTVNASHAAAIKCK